MVVILYVNCPACKKTVRLSSCMKHRNKFKALYVCAFEGKSTIMSNILDNAATFETRNEANRELIDAGHVGVDVNGLEVHEI